MTVVVGNHGTPLHQAALKGHKEIVSVLLDAGCPTDVVDIEGCSALHYAAGHGAVEVMGVLIESRFGCQSREDNDGWTPLHLASVCGELEAVRELLRLGANTSVICDYATPLHQAALKGHKEIVSVLVVTGKLEAVRELLRLGANASMTVVAGEYGTPLHQAALKGHKEIVSVLLDAGCPNCWMQVVLLMK
jgi:4-hydroxy-3-methylbut-2-enyl diphosphate reductase IspH